MNLCEDAAPVGTRVIKRTFVERNGYKYPTQVEGKVVDYHGHVGADFHVYMVAFEAPVYEHTNDLVLQMFEYDLFFPDGQSGAEQAKKILKYAREKK